MQEEPIPSKTVHDRKGGEAFNAQSTHINTTWRDPELGQSPQGRPAIARVRDSFGDVKARLALKFDRTDRPMAAPSVDDGLSPVSWSAWLAELDRQNLALQVDDTSEFEFVARRGEHPGQNSAH